jgi:N-acetylgalactosamine-N,N'-diacetylbacillosaminyl-diphospho-undecaprenol 4-alpha-N-acetylgalactosaminyltransferase
MLLRNSEEWLLRYEIVVALLDDEVDEAYSLPEWVRVERLTSGSSLARSVAGLDRLVRTLRPACVFSFLTRSNVAAIIAARNGRCATVVSERVNTSAHLATARFSFVSRALVRWTYPRADRVVAVSAGVRDTLAADFAVDPSRIRVIANPVDATRIRSDAATPDPLGAGPDDWVTMGRLVPNKNAALAISAFAQAGLPGRLLVLGEGPLRAELEQLAEQLGVGTRVIFAGFVSNPYAVLARAGAYCLPSKAEGFPNALVEAMALGKPVVATDCPSGPSEILETSLDNQAMVKGTGGYLVPCDDPTAMARAMRALADDHARTALEEAGRARAEDFSVFRAVSGFWQVIEAAIYEHQHQVRT